MLVASPEPERALMTEQIDCDLAIIGGGLAGTCCAITAARAGLRVTLIQDRPVLGGNASSEVRLWALGATAHMGNNNRWAREGGVIGEILVENTFRNPEGNPLIMDTILLEKVMQEERIRLLLNTAVYEVSKSDPDTIGSVRGFCSQNSTLYDVRTPLFVDASGDGIVGFLSGAAFRMGAETEAEFGEKLAPSEEYGHLLGHSLYFYSKDTGRPVRFVPPSYALTDITQIPRFRSFNTAEYGCRLWWIEYGGRLDTVHATEAIKWELWKVVYGVWNYIKNSGQFPEAETLTLEWVGTIPGKRESRRFEGDYILRQQDIIEQRPQPDAVSYGGWALDLHPADGIYSEKPGCNQWHSRGVYAIPYRSLYSRNISNLFLAGRIISASHVAFGSTRVMLTLAHAAQAVGVAAALCIRESLKPRAVGEPDVMAELQRHLLRRGQYIPGLRLNDPEDLTRLAAISASSTLTLSDLPPDGPVLPLNYSWAQMLPLPAHTALPAVSFCVDVAEPTTLTLELRSSDQPHNHTPDVILHSVIFNLSPGQAQSITYAPPIELPEAQYVYVCLMKNPAVSVYTSQTRITGVLAVANAQNPAVSNYGAQQPTEDIGVESFEFWVPLRRPHGHNLAFSLDAPLHVFGAENVADGAARPIEAPHAWVADPTDPSPTLHLNWATPQIIGRVELEFDTDHDHPMESVLMTHPETVMPFCVTHYRLKNERGEILYECTDNHQTLNTVVFDQPVMTTRLSIEVVSTHGGTPAALFGMRCYAHADQRIVVAE